MVNARNCASREPPKPATIAATSAAAPSNPNARVSVKDSATPKATATTNHAIHGMKAAFREERLPRKYLAGCGSTRRIRAMAPPAILVRRGGGGPAPAAAHGQTEWAQHR